MSRVTVQGFVGGSNTLRSIQANPARAINVYTESTSPGLAKSETWMQATPGLRVFANFPGAPIRGLFEINDRAFVVGGDFFAEVFGGGTFGPLFSIANDLQPASFASNGSAGGQVMVVSGNLGYIYDLTADTFTQITDPDFPSPCRCCEFMDGYFLAQQGGGSRRFQWSALEDGTSWDPLDVAERSEAADNITSLIRNHREIWLIGFRTTEVWYDTGDPASVFAPLQGVFVEMGGQGVFTPQRIDNTLVWMTLNDNGQGMVVRANGYTPQVLSTFAVDIQLQRADTPTDARAWVYQMNGHLFYVLILPRQETSWVYDITMNSWHEWASWDSTACVWLPHVAGSHVFVFNKHLVGDRYSGGIYELNQDFAGEQVIAA